MSRHVRSMSSRPRPMRRAKHNRSIAKLAKKVSAMQVALKPEKKRFNVFTSMTPFGQANGNVVAPYLLDITPGPAQSVAVNGHVGASIKETGVHIEMLIQHQSATAGPISCCAFIVQVKGTPRPSTVWMEQMWNENPFNGVGVGVRDLNSSRQMDYIANYRILSAKRFRMAPDNISGVNMPKTLKFGYKFKTPHTIHYDGNLNTTLSGQTFLMIVADGGNCSSTTANTLFQSAPYTAVNTGLLVSSNVTSYFIDP